jgi:Tfp pilus assembly protein PilO
VIALQEAPIPPLPPPTVIVGGEESMPAPVFLLAMLAMLATVIIIFLPLMKAWARRIDGRSIDANEVRAELDDLRARMQELEVERTRFVELEERIDFAERLLTQGRERQEERP